MLLQTADSFPCEMYTSYFKAVGCIKGVPSGHKVAILLFAYMPTYITCMQLPEKSTIYMYMYTNRCKNTFLYTSHCSDIMLNITLKILLP